MKNLNKFSRKTINKLLKGISKRDKKIDSLIHDHNKLVDEYNSLAKQNKTLSKKLGKHKGGFGFS